MYSISDLWNIEKEGYMKSIKIYIITIYVLSLVFMSGTASAIGFEMSVGAWKQDPQGDLSYKALSAQDSLSVKDDLKYSDVTKIFGRMKIEIPLVPNIYLMATPMEFSGKGSKDVTFEFGNTQFKANTPFTSELRLNHYDIGLYYGIPLLKKATAGFLNIDIGLDARIIDFKAQITGKDSITDLSITQSKALTLSIPMLFMGVQLKPTKWFAAEGEVRAITYAGNYFYDIIGRAKVKPFGPVFASAGYRYEKVKIDTNDVLAEVNFGGPFAEVGVEF
jgi:outer membrane protein